MDPGVLIDDRSADEKLKDYTFEELVSAPAPVAWREKKASEWRSFPIFDQNGSGSCVAQTLRKMLGIYVHAKTGAFVPLSASHIYQRRRNRPSAGMAGDDVFKIGQKGTTLELLAGSEKMTDAQMDATKVNEFSQSIGESFKIGNYMQISDRKIDTIASIIDQTKKGVMVWFYFSSGLKPKEWTDVPAVQHKDLTLTGANTARHSVTAVDFTLYKGKKALIIEDSWGLDAAMQGRRIITEDFFNARCYYAAHFMNFAFEDESEASPVTPAAKPRHTFSADLEFSSIVTYTNDVKMLQECLKYLGLFPSNVDSTGFFGAVTKKAVEQFQLKEGISAPGVDGFGRVGPRTRAVLNRLFA